MEIIVLTLCDAAVDPYEIYSSATFRTMDVGSHTLENVGDMVILRSDPYEKVDVVNGYVQSIIDEDGTYYSEYRWSHDGITFSEWNALTDENLVEYTKIPDVDGKLWIEWKYTLLSGRITVQWVYLNFDEIPSEDERACFIPLPIAFPDLYGGPESSIINTSVQQWNSVWNPHQHLQRLSKIYRDMDFMTNNIYGYEVTYYKLSPREGSRDVSYAGEYTLYNMSEGICIKILVPDGEFPSLDPTFNSFGIEFEVPFEVHMDKAYYESVFGRNMAPQRGDVIYFHLDNRLFEILSTTIVRDFAQNPIYWKMSLSKYQPKSNVIADQSVYENLEKYARDMVNLFDVERENEQTKIVNPQQSDDKTLYTDPIRSWVDRSMIIRDDGIVNYHTTIAGHYYDLDALFRSVDMINKPAVKYKAALNVPKANDFGITMWFREKGVKVQFKNIIRVDKYALVPGTYDIFFESEAPVVRRGDWLKVSTPEDTSFSFHAYVEDIDREFRKVRIHIEDGIQDILDANYPTWYITFSALVGRPAFRRVLISSFTKETNLGIELDSFDSSYFRLNVDGALRYFLLTTPLSKDIWYGLVLNMSNTFNQIGLHLWEMKNPLEKNVKLNEIHRFVIHGVSQKDYISAEPYSLQTGPIHITNVRVLNYMLEPDRQSKFLNRMIVNDADRCTIIDNAIPRLTFPRIGIMK